MKKLKQIWSFKLIKKSNIREVKSFDGIWYRISTELYKKSCKGDYFSIKLTWNKNKYCWESTVGNVYKKDSLENKKYKAVIGKTIKVKKIQTKPQIPKNRSLVLAGNVPKFEGFEKLVNSEKHKTIQNINSFLLQPAWLNLIKIEEPFDGKKERVTINKIKRVIGDISVLKEDVKRGLIDSSKIEKIYSIHFSFWVKIIISYYKIRIEKSKNYADMINKIFLEVMSTCYQY